MIKYAEEADSNPWLKGSHHNMCVYIIAAWCSHAVKTVFGYEDTDHIFIMILLLLPTPLHRFKRCRHFYAYLYINNCVQWLEEVFIPLELFYIFSCYNHKHECISLGFYVINTEWRIIVEWKENDKWFSNIFTNKNTEKFGVQKYSPPFTLIP